MFLYILAFAVVIWLFYKTRKDYSRLLKAAKTGKPNDILINPRSFIWKGGIFVFAALYLSQTANNQNITLSLVLFAALFTLGLWNFYHAFLYKRNTKN